MDDTEDNQIYEIDEEYKMEQTGLQMKNALMFEQCSWPERSYLDIFRSVDYSRKCLLLFSSRFSGLKSDLE